MKKGFVAQYWENRYKAGGNSGLGSHDQQAIHFKADYVNKLIVEHGVKTVIEYGCGDGNQLGLLKGYENYFGNDISETIVNKCSVMYKDDDTKTFEYDLSKLVNNKYDLSISLDVIYHLVEDEVFETYMDNLFNTSNLVSMYTTDHADITNTQHIKHRKVTEYVAERYPEFELVETVPFSKYNVMFLTYKRK